MPKSHKRSPIITRKTLYWILSVSVVCYLFHLSVDVQNLSRFVETDPNDVFYLLKDPVNLLILHPKVVEIQILNRHSQMTLDFAEFYMTEQLSFGNSTTLVNMVANPVDRSVSLKVNTFLDLLHISIDWKIHSKNKGTKTYTQIEEEIRVKCPMLFKYVIGDLLYEYHHILMDRIQLKYSSEPSIALM
ncbi:Hypothetical predicted protein [Mytilus galloprovincialis]|uniref:Uncharacterized protein n=1 Tax=Mytilus galloprovincialis TaxID=29158 RepID=A0A8B6DE37_MYTGA|nr:Hypothetical predicted protein [Mytilus galloprovincialis]